MNKQPEVCKQTKANLIEAFWHLYKDNKLYKIKIKDITDKAGYNRSTFYEYFFNIDDLLEYAEEQLINKMIQQLEEAVENFDSEELIVKAAKVYEYYGYYLSILLGPTGDPAFAEKYKAAVKLLIIKKFNLKEDDFRIDILCEYSFGAILYSITYWYKNGKSFSAEELASLLYTIMKKGMFSVLT
ncbi:TetR/AcrR family transcriptional regulator [Clostridium sp. 1001271B_151109_B4]|uniref:TetR/AcrR family transcriptional regulator C-terminal domain-containing protein n=1 Tax=Clostridium sp. 1001271B_151109_B4 TaxID=2787148 RepID=UPI0018AA56F5